MIGIADDVVSIDQGAVGASRLLDPGPCSLRALDIAGYDDDFDFVSVGLVE